MKRCVWMIAIICLFAGWASAGSATNSGVTGEAYFDMATGHKYVKNTGASYAEYSKRGKLLRMDVPNTLPLLIRGRSIVEMTPDHYLVYETRRNADLIQRVLPAFSPHPRGWRCQQIVLAIQRTAALTAEAYE